MLAEALGVTQAAVASYYTNEKSLLKYADLFDVFSNQIFGRSVRYQNSNFDLISTDLKCKFVNLLADSLKLESKSRKVIEDAVNSNNKIVIN